MIIIDEVLNAINTAMELAQKKNDKEVAEKLVSIYIFNAGTKRRKRRIEKQTDRI